VSVTLQVDAVERSQLGLLRLVLNPRGCMVESFTTPGWPLFAVPVTVVVLEPPLATLTEAGDVAKVA